MKNYFITVAGNIAAGKTSLTDVLSKQFGWHPFYESADGNPYLSDFYNDMKKWAFHSQIYFLTQKVKAFYNIAKYNKSMIVDRTFYEDGEIFAKNLHITGLMNDNDYNTYMELFKFLTEFLPKPDIMIYLRANVDFLHNRIMQRSRVYELGVSKEYLNHLNTYYEDWIQNYKGSKLLIINAEDYDYLKNEKDLKAVIEQVQKFINVQ